MLEIGNVKFVEELIKLMVFEEKVERNLLTNETFLEKTSKFYINCPNENGTNRNIVIMPIDILRKVSECLYDMKESDSSFRTECRVLSGNNCILEDGLVRLLVFYNTTNKGYVKGEFIFTKL